MSLGRRLAGLGFLLVLSGLRADAAATVRPVKPGARPRAILVGWDGGDWRLLDPLVSEGKLPNLARLLERGRSWSLASYQPLASPLIWTTIATGRTPVDHGVCDFQELDPATKARLPISSRSRRVPALWNLASARGVSVGVVGWWATWPAERVKGFLVSDRASPVLFDFEALSKSSALAWPEGLAEGVRLVVKREGAPGFGEVSQALHVSRPEFDRAVAQKLDLGHPITGYQKILGSTRVTARIALDLYERERPELLMVYFQGTDEIGHVLGRYHPPRLPTVSDEDFRRYSAGVTAYYQEVDRILGELMGKAERDGATLILASDHGFKWAGERPAYYSGTQVDTAFLWHQSPGILAAVGPAVVPSRKRDSASVFDLTPTLCRILGLPPDPAFEGKVVAGLAGRTVPKPVAAIAWEKNAPVERLVISTASAEDRKAAEEFTRKLIALGYLTGAEASAVDARAASRAGTETAGQFQNVGTFLRERGQAERSLEWYRKALEVNPKSGTAWVNLSASLLALERFGESDDALISACKSGYNDPEATIYQRVAVYARAKAKNPKAGALLVDFMKKVTTAYPESARYRSSLGKALFESDACEAALEIFQGLVARAPADFESWNLVALSSLCLGRPLDARQAFQRSLAIKADQPAVREGLDEIDRAAPPSSTPGRTRRKAS